MSVSFEGSSFLCQASQSIADALQARSRSRSQPAVYCRLTPKPHAHASNLPKNCMQYLKRVHATQRSAKWRENTWLEEHGNCRWAWTHCVCVSYFPYASSLNSVTGAFPSAAFALGAAFFAAALGAAFAAFAAFAGLDGASKYVRKKDLENTHERLRVNFGSIRGPLGAY